MEIHNPQGHILRPNPLLTDWQKEDLFLSVKRECKQRWPDHPQSGLCLYNHIILIRELWTRHKITLQLQAGTCYYLRNPNRELQNCSFGYEFKLEEALPRIEQNLLPEMHVWALDGFNEHVVDLTTGDFVAQCRTLDDLDWHPDLIPPKYLWGPFPYNEKVTYQADVNAIQIAIAYAVRSFERSEMKIVFKALTESIVR